MCTWAQSSAGNHGISNHSPIFVSILGMKKVVKSKRFLWTGIPVLLVAGLYLSPWNYLFKGIGSTYLKGRSSAHFYDYRDFDLRKVPKGGNALNLPAGEQYNKIPLSESLKAMLKETRSGSFMVLRNDSIIAEHYFDKHTDTTLSNAFSMTKTIVTMLVQLAIQEGKISGWDEKAVRFIPELSGEFASELTLRHLSTMTAGLDWKESYKNPFGITAKAYYGTELNELMLTVRVVKKPGENYVYQSGATQLLGMCLMKATGKTVADYASEKLWSKIGTEASAYWHLDKKDGTELCYCCFNAVTRDFGRLGSFLLHNGKGLLDSGFLAMATKPYRAAHYGHSFWISESGKTPYYFFHGTQGQFIAIIPEANMVVVRTGAGDKKGNTPIPDCISLYVKESLKLFGGK
jgi:CubicO group peptidase (beta-lactamase class C family)